MLNTNVSKKTQEKEQVPFRLKVSHPIFLVLVLGFFFFSVPAVFANILGNPDFASPLGNGTEGNWQQNFDNPCTGAVPAGWPTACVFLPERWDNATLTANGYATSSSGYALRLKAYFDNPAFYRNSYTFQVKNGVKPGDYVTFSAKAQSDVKAGDTGAFIVIEFKDESDNLISSQQNATKITIFSAPVGTWTSFSAQGVAPAGTQKVVFTLKTDGIKDGVVPQYGTTVFSDVNGEVNPAKLSVSASKRNVSPGDAVGINVNFNNASGNTLTGVELRATLPHGLDYAAKSIRVNGRQASYREGSLIIPIGTMTPGEVFTTNFVMLVTSGVQLGKEYSMEFTLVGSSDLSEKASL